MRLSLLGIAGLSLLAIGCREGAGTGSVEGGPVVARVGGAQITAGEFVEKLKEQPPFVRARYASLEAKRELLDSQIRFEVLLAEARRQKLDQDPELLATVEKLLVQRLVQRTTDAAAKEQPAEEEVRAYYQAHLTEFVRPERVRVSHILLATAADAPQRAQTQAEAERLLGEIRKKESGPVRSAFGETAQRRSDDAATRALAGDLGFKTHEELAAQWGAEVADAAFALKNLGDLGKASGAKGVQLLKLLGRQPGMSRSFEEARAQVESRAKLEHRAKAVDALVQKLRDQARPEIDEKALSAIQVKADGTVAVQAEP